MRDYCLTVRTGLFSLELPADLAVCFPALVGVLKVVCLPCGSCAALCCCSATLVWVCSGRNKFCPDNDALC